MTDHSQEPVRVTRVGSNGLATASLVLGILGLLLAFVPFLTVIGLILAILAVVLGGVGLSQASRRQAGKGLAIAGLVLGLVACAAAIAIIAETAKQLEKL